MDKKSWLSILYYDMGKQQTDFRCCYTWKEGEETKFTKWIKYLEIQDQPKKLDKINQREQLKNEIILDYDRGGMEQYQLLISKLKEEGIKFYAFATSEGRARQIHTFWDQLVSLKKLDRELFRESIIKKYDCDVNYKIDSHVVPLEYFEHWKTGKIKDLLDKVEGVNEVEKFKEETDTEEEPDYDIGDYLSNAEDFHIIQPYFYDRSGIFWFWNKDQTKYEIKDDVDVMNAFDRVMGFEGETIGSHVKNQVLESLRRVGRERIPKPSKKKWVQFKDKAISLKSGKVHKVTPDYFFTNPISFELGQTSDTPVMDRLFKEWVGEDHVQLLYEILAYCCYTDYPIHRIFCLIGAGSNGKSRFLELMKRFLGAENICSTELDTLIDRNFESFKLYKKLVCTIGETNFGRLSKTSLLKKLSGQDLVGFEKKGKDPFDDMNYAKILISSNSLPSSDDTSDGFYRRFTIVEFPNQFEEGKDILDTIPDIEYPNLARKVTEILPKLLDYGKFTNQGSIQDRKEKYILASNPISTFIRDYCNVGDNLFYNYSKFYTIYLQYLKIIKKRRVRTKEFRAVLEDEGLFVEKTSKRDENSNWVNTYWVEGIEINEDKFKSLGQMGRLGCVLELQLCEKKSSIERKSVENSDSKTHPKCPIYPKTEEIIIDTQNEIPLNWDVKALNWHYCHVEGCGGSPCNEDLNGKLYCIKHWENMARR